MGTGDESDEREYETGERIEFPVVVSNIGGYYNNDLHEFTCPVTGIYMFTVSVRSGNGGTARLTIILGGTQVVSAHSDGRNEGPEGSYTFYGHGSNIAVVECDQGQKVWVDCRQDARVFDNALWFTTFSGVLLHAV